MAENKANRNYKSNIFEMIFREKKALLELYNAINGTEYQNPQDLEINTLENAVYISMKNDLSFVLDWRLNLYEHQSTYNPNMPLRDLFYVTKVYSGMIDERKLLGSKRICIPAPKFIVFYNGQKEQPERQEMKLSDSYTVEDEEIALELKVLVLNVNLGQNKELMEACKSLNDYAVYVDRVRRYQKTMTLEEAVDRAIKECIEEGVLKEFLTQNLKEAREASILEYTFEEAIVVAREEGQEYGWAAGVEEGMKAGREEGMKAGREEGMKAGREEGMKAGREEGMKAGREEGMKAGREEGIQAGERRKLLEMVQKKLAKNKNAEEIADSLEEDVKVILELIDELTEK